MKSLPADEIQSEEGCFSSGVGTHELARKAGVGPRNALFIDNPVFARRAYNAQHPLGIARTETVLELADLLGWLPTGALQTSAPAALATLCQFHDEDYVAALRAADQKGRVDRASRQRYGFGTMENPLFSGVFKRAATTVGGSILAAELALNERIVYHPAGGTHHGQPARASGFCYFNDPVFALLRFLDAGLERLCYVDLDAHHGDGVEAAFANNSCVFLASIHETERWPHTGAASIGERILNLPVRRGCDDAEFRHCIDDVVLPFVKDANPQAIVITCGADALAGDPLSTMQLSNVALWDAVQQVARLAPAVVVLGGGGYNPWTLARCWLGLWGRLAGFEIPSELPSAARAILGALECDLVDEDTFDPAWLTTLADRAADESGGRQQ